MGHANSDIAVGGSVGREPSGNRLGSDETPAGGSHRLRVARLVVGYAAVVAVLPYLALKVLWVSGVMIGVPAGSPARAAGFVGANIVTGGLDVVAILAALAFTHRWGRRLPPCLILPPIWVGTGLLIPAAVEVVNGAVAAALTAGRAVSLAGGLVAPWTYLVVYTSFGLQAVLLTTAFVWYARNRWADVFDRANGATGPSPTADLQRVLATAGAVTGGAVAVSHLVMAFCTEGAFAGAYQHGWQYTARSGEVVNAAMAVLAAVGILVLTRRPGTGRPMPPWWMGLAFTWAGAGAMFAYALLTLVAIVAGAPESDTVTPLGGLTQLGALLGGIVIGLTGAFHLAERRAVAAARTTRDNPARTAGDSPWR
jgi:hypothetical protein